MSDPLLLNHPPTPHPSRGVALLRDWSDRYTAGKKALITLGLLLVMLLMVDPCRQALRDGIGRWFHILLVSWLLTTSLTPLAELFSLKAGAVDWPDRRKIHDRPTPRLGGIAVFLGILTSLALNGVPDPRITLLAVCAVALFLLGVVDDLSDISAKIRLATQIVLSLILVQGGLYINIFPHGTVPGALGNTILTVLWITGITNAFNFFDGMDGLASGLAVVQAGFLGAIAFTSGQPHLGWVSVAVIGSCLGFLPYNFRWNRPAAVFMGDGGSTVLGFLLAGLAIHGEWVVGPAWVNLSAPILIFGVLIYDMIHTTVSRIVRGDVRSFSDWLAHTGRDHLHHRFEALLRSKRYAVLLVFLLAACLGLLALILRETTPAGTVIVLLQSLALLVLVTILERSGNLHERRRTEPGDPKE